MLISLSLYIYIMYSNYYFSQFRLDESPGTDIARLDLDEFTIYLPQLFGESAKLECRRRVSAIFFLISSGRDLLTSLTSVFW